MACGTRKSGFVIVTWHVARVNVVWRLRIVPTSWIFQVNFARTHRHMLRSSTRLISSPYLRGALWGHKERLEFPHEGFRDAPGCDVLKRSGLSRRVHRLSISRRFYRPHRSSRNPQDARGVRRAPGTSPRNLRNALESHAERLEPVDDVLETLLVA